MSLPKDFVWGAATSSYQIEGSVGGGRGECIWHRFSHTPGKVVNNENGDRACDHLHLFRDDVALMKELGLHAYRFSTAWPRILPKGTGAINAEGLDFYDALVDSLLAANITPYLTLYHWDLPQALQDRGGWENPDSVQWFVEYTQIAAHRLGDRVKHWITHNEPVCTAFLGNLFGIHAPGKQDPQAAFRVAHHVMISHGAAVRALRAAVPDAQVGIAINMNGITPASDREEDLRAARTQDGFANRWFLDPAFRGTYPEDIVALLGNILDGLDLAAISEAAQPIDFMGLNYYQRNVFAYDAGGLYGIKEVRLPDVPRTAMGWEVHPQSLTDILVRLKDDYAPAAILITENGAAYDDPAPVDGLVNDPERIAYYDSHIKAVEAAVALGAPVTGYFAWSLFDNFEWAEGYAKRFGIVHVDFETLKRTPKASARFLQRLIARQSV